MHEQLDWFDIDAQALNDSEPSYLGHGVSVRVGMSPYDIPDGVRGYYDDSIGKFVIEFRYMTSEEPCEPVAQNATTTLMLGINSRRLYAIHVDVDSIGAQAVELTYAPHHGEEPYPRVESTVYALTDQAAEAIDSLIGRNETASSRHSESTNRLRQQYSAAKRALELSKKGFAALRAQ